ncbi:MAG: divalent-cation tolerance protein CutA [Thaumarchaeota archaeon]|nr:divalent-cation tolerance protein CutA [Nitrososphaerota archaeon]MCY3975826.1 divalent-cation tolerance protein CutA [Nitrososphaerota archaeon]
MKFIILMTTYDKKELAMKNASICINNSIAACVNIIKISSIYSWNKKLENCNEFLTVFKTTNKNKQTLVDFIKKTHSYDTPEIIEIPAVSVDRKYYDWLISQTSNVKTKS